MLRWTLQLALANAITLDAWTTILFQGTSLDYIIYFSLSILTAASIYWLGTVTGYFEKLITPATAALTTTGDTIMKIMTTLLHDVRASHTYSGSTNQFYTNRNMPATRPFIHRRPRTNVPHRRTYRGRRYCALLATIHTCIAAQVTAFPSNMEHGPRATALEARFDTNSFTLGLDGHSSRCMSPHRSQFTNLQPWNGPNIKGIGTAPIEGIGTIDKWSFACDKGQTHTFKIENCLYVPSLHKAILSPQHFALDCATTSTSMTALTTGATMSKLQFGSKGEYIRTVQHTKSTNVPDIQANESCRNYYTYAATTDSINDTYQLESYMCMPCAMPATTMNHEIPNGISDDEEDVQSTSSNQDNEEFHDTVEDEIFIQENNISDHFVQSLPLPPTNAAQEGQDLLASTDTGELLRYHYKLGHLPFSRLQSMAEAGLIPKRLSKTKLPICAACNFGKLTKKNWRSRAKNKRKIIPADRPGAVVSVDQLESTTHGMIAQLKGKVTHRRYKAATIFVDHYSDASFIHLQETLTSEDTIRAKEAFEAWSRTNGISQVQHYHCDNGRFTDNAWTIDARKKGQTVTFCGVNAHFQNGRAEKRIRDLRESARTSLHHAMSRWPGVVDLHLWPYALRYANDVHNLMPDKNGNSRLQKFAKVPIQCNLNNFHSFGCPVYALDSKLAAGQKIPHWNSRSRVGINLGFSLRHARNVALVLNTTTGTVSPQYHVKYDDFFTSVSPTAGNSPTTSLWQAAAGFKGAIKKEPESLFKRLTDRTYRKQPVNPKATPTGDPIQEPPKGDEGPADTTTVPREPEPPGQANLPSFNTSPTDDPTGDDTTVRRSSRIRKPTAKLQDSVEMGLLQGFNAESYQDEVYYDALHQDEYFIQDQMADPIAFLSTMKKKSDPDTMYYHQAMAAPDRKEFQKAMLKEFRDHCEREHWELVEKSEVPENTKIIDAVWSMKRKRDIKTRETYKWKARLNVHGGQQEYGVNYWETYAPVVNWFSIRLLLAQALLNNWHTRQVDFVLAYPQADIETELFMKLPRGIQLPNNISNETHALRLKKNVYGQKQAGRVWVNHLQKGLRNIGFTPSAIDDCVWYRKDVIFTFYVDDGILWSPREEGISEFLRDMRNETLAGAKYDIDDMGDVNDYLGINFEVKEGKIVLSQPHLIDQIVQEVLGDNPTCRAKPIPAPSTKILDRDLNGADFNYNFDYRSIVGKLNYLEKGTRPELAYSVHQCARFCTNPKKSHGDAIINIAKYLKDTRAQGIIVNPDPSKSFEVYADADFSGNWNKHTAHLDSTTAKSRSGYIIMLHGVPLIWHSKLQTQIALSTTEAEYIALSQSLRDTIPIMNLLLEMHNHGFKGDYTRPIIHCKAFEDNSGALELAKTPKMRPRTKHINLVYHHFRFHVLSGAITIHAIDTKSQLADLLTKPLDQNLFQKHRNAILGW